MKKTNLGAFTIDYVNRRLLVAYQSENTIKSVSLDGNIVVDIRTNVKFKNVTSVSMSNGLFYWINGKEIFTESYEQSTKKYQYNGIFNR